MPPPLSGRVATNGRTRRTARCAVRAAAVRCIPTSRPHSRPTATPTTATAVTTSAAAEPAPADHASHAPAVPESPSSDQCTLGGTCSAPVNALAVILSNHGVVPAATLLPGNADRAPAPLPTRRTPDQPSGRARQSTSPRVATARFHREAPVCFAARGFRSFWRWCRESCTTSRPRELHACVWRSWFCPAIG